MGGEGAMMNMIQSLRENRRIRRSIRRKFKNGEAISTSHKDWKIYKPDITDKELQKIIAKIKLKAQKRNRNFLYARIFLFSVVLLLTIYFWKYVLL